MICLDVESFDAAMELFPDSSVPIVADKRPIALGRVRRCVVFVTKDAVGA